MPWLMLPKPILPVAKDGNKWQEELFLNVTRSLQAFVKGSCSR